MNDGRDLLREFHRLGVRIELAGDRFRLTPPGVAPEDLRLVLREYRPEVQALLEQLPAGGRCPICGGSTGWPDLDQLHCVECVLLACEREGYAPKGDEMVIEMVCTDCGQTFANTKADLILPPAEYRKCRECRAKTVKAA